MPVATYAPLPPELGPGEIDARSIEAFRHGLASPLIRWHYHDEYELHLIVASAGRMFVGDYIGSFASGQLVLTGPRLPHNWISHSPAGPSIDERDYVVQFRRHLVKTMAEGALELKALLPLLERARYGVEFGSPVRLDAKPWFERMMNTEGSARIGMLIEFLDRLSREHEYRMLSAVPSCTDTRAAPAERLERVVDYITEHHAGPVSLASVAHVAGMSDSAFSHFFAKATGRSYTEFLNRVRVAHACELLGVTDKPITEICHAVGFNNVANFNRRFRELRQLTPREYRKQTLLGHRV